MLRRPEPAPLDAARRTTGVVRLVLLLVTLGACAALPWLVPAIPGVLGSSVPGSPSSASPVVDPTVEPAQGLLGSTGVSRPGGPYSGVRLASAGTPLELRVARLHVDAPVERISGQSGQLTPPADPQVLGWWQEGRVAGAKNGSAVVTGHTVHTGGGVFDHLGELVPGDRIRVRTRAGWITYLVQRSRTYSVAALSRDAEKIFRLDGSGRLVLITCSDFDGSVYLTRSVVFAVPVRDEPFRR